MRHTLKPASLAAKQILIFLSVIVVGTVLVKTIWFNLAPYILLFGGTAPTPSGLFLIGWFVDLAQAIFNSLQAFVVWAGVNVLQLLWLIIRCDHRYRRYMQRQGLVWEGLKIPYPAIELSPLLGIAATAFDAVVNFQTHPFISLAKFIPGLFLGKALGIDWMLFLNFAGNMIVMETLALLLIILIDWMISPKHR